MLMNLHSFAQAFHTLLHGHRSRLVFGLKREVDQDSKARSKDTKNEPNTA
jgi:hypothetical protein